ncbi:MAG: hypothetical protein ACJAXQ_001495 [Parvibaculaceae bacterium]
MGKLKISRRAAALGLLTGATGLLSYRAWHVFENDSSVFIITDPDKAEPEGRLFNTFKALSQIVTFRSDLHEPTLETIYRVFHDEPWMAEHTLTSYEQLKPFINQEIAPTSNPKLALGEGQKWFTEHLLTTWYLGIYYHDRTQPIRVAYEHALMFDAIKETQPIPLIDATGPRGWSSKPEAL